MTQRNGLGVFGFFVALIGLFIPTGIVALLGLVLSLAAIGRAPRGFATFGVILGVIGTVLWSAIMIGVLAVGLVGAVVVAAGGAAMFLLVQPEAVELTSDMINVAIAVEEYQRDHDALPAELAVLPLGVARTMDPWGQHYRLVLSPGDEPGFDLVSGGPDRAFETDDDIQLSRLDRFWERTLESFDERLEEFGQRMERLDREGPWSVSTAHGHRHQPRRGAGSWYEEVARDALEHGTPHLERSPEVPPADPVEVVPAAPAVPDRPGVPRWLMPGPVSGD